MSNIVKQTNRLILKYSDNSGYTLTYKKDTEHNEFTLLWVSSVSNKDIKTLVDFLQSRKLKLNLAHYATIQAEKCKKFTRVVFNGDSVLLEKNLVKEFIEHLKYILEN